MKSNLKKFRRKAGITQEELGDMCCISGSIICRLEGVRANPTLSTAYSIAKVLDKSVEEIWPNTVEFVEETITVRRIKV